VAGMIRSIQISNKLIGNRTHYLPAYSITHNRIHNFDTRFFLQVNSGLKLCPYLIENISLCVLTAVVETSRV
jgi:hypothetical protein